MLGIPRVHRVAAAVMLATVMALTAASVQPAPRDNRETLLVGLHPGAPSAGLRGVLGAAGATITTEVDPLQLLVVRTRPGSTEAVVSRLERHPAVRYVERDREMQFTSTPSDPLYPEQWGLDRIKASEAWDLLPSGAERTLVAVLDSGIDYDHPDLAGQISSLGCDLVLSGSCGADGRGVPARDFNGHGTHVAGIIGAVTNNTTGVASAAAGRVTLLPIKVSIRATGAIPGSVVINALIFAVENGAKVINMSFGPPCGAEPSQALREAIAFAEQRDVLLVISAGNEGGCPQGRYPANDPRVLAVAAVDRTYQSPPFTNRGLWIGVAAPGVSILSTYRGGYASISGTSQAAPHVAGIAALLFQVPGATREKVKGWLLSTCDTAAGVGVQCGGVINAYRAMHLAVRGTDPAIAPPQPLALPPVTPPAPPASPTGDGSSLPDPTGPPPPDAGSGMPPVTPAGAGMTAGAVTPAARPQPPALPPGFVPSEETLAATVPMVASGGTATVSWNGAFWLSAPVVTFGLCGVGDPESLAATEAALDAWRSAPGMSWRIVRNDDACGAEFDGPRVLVTREVLGDDLAIDLTNLTRTTATDGAGTPCDAAAPCWTAATRLTINGPAFKEITVEARPLAMVQAVGRALGLGEATHCGATVMWTGSPCEGSPAGVPGVDDLTSLDELLAVTLRALRP